MVSERDTCVLRLFWLKMLGHVNKTETGAEGASKAEQMELVSDMRR